MYHIERALFPEDLEAVLTLYREYIASTSVDLSFQGNDREFQYLAEKYSVPDSKIFLAKHDKTPVGCAAFRKVDERICEMKRVYVRPGARGARLGARLVERVLQEAARSGYQKICLDVLPEFRAALALYLSFGFTPHPPITHNPVPGTRFLGLNLAEYQKILSQN